MGSFLTTRSSLALPPVSSPDFLPKLKALIDLREGQTRDQDSRFVTVEQLRAMGVTVSGNFGGGRVVISQGTTGSQPTGDSTPPNPPSNLVITNNIINHRLTWVNPGNKDLSHVEVWRSETQDLLLASLVGIATKPVNNITLFGVSPRENYYYWVRAVDTSGNYSIWNPNNQQGGELVNGEVTSTINALLSKMLNDTSYEQEHVIIADSFKIIQPNAGLTQGKPVFVVGNIGGTPTVGIDGSLLVDGTIYGTALHAGTITADKIGAKEVNATHIAANEINGDHISATSDIILNEGGRLTVGSNNIVLDSVNDEIRVAPDNGTVAGQPNYNGVDYCQLKDGDISFMYWNGTSHQLYNSLKRVETGMAVPNNVSVTLPGIWKNEPKIIVSPADIMTYNKNYNANQTLVCQAEDITRSGLTYTFTPKAFLRLTEGSVGTPISAAAGITAADRRTWVYANSPTFQTPINSIAVTVAGKIQGGNWEYNGFEQDGDWSYGYRCKRFYVRGWLYVNGVAYYIGEWTAKQTSTAVWNFTKTVADLASGQHTCFLRVGYYREQIQLLPVADRLLGSDKSGRITGLNLSTNQSTFVSVSNGTLNYLAIGE